MKPILLSLLALLIFGVSALAADRLGTLEQELQALEQELPDILKEEVDLGTRQTYVNRVLELREKIEALEGVDAGQCWFRNESAFLYPADPNVPPPPPSECDFYGSCEEAARFAQKKGYGFEGKCETTPGFPDSRRVLQLTQIHARPSFTRGDDFEFNHAPGSAGMDRHFSKTKTINGSTMKDGQDVVQKELKQESLGFTQFPDKIILGEPFTFQTSLRAQRTKTNSLCGGSETLQSEAYVRLRRADVWERSAFSALHQVGDVVDEDCAHTPRKHNVTLGGDSTATVECLPEEPEKKAEPGEENTFTYECTLHSKTIPKRPENTKLLYVWPLGPVDTNGNFKDVNGSEFNSRLLMTLGFNSIFGPDDAQEVVLEYAPVLKGKPANQMTAALYSHPFDLTPGGQQPGSESQENAGIVAREPNGDSAGGKTSEGRETGEQTGGGATTNQTTGTEKLNPNNPDIALLIEEWLRRAEPPQNATEEGNFRYNQWGQLVGTSADGGVAEPKSRPDAAAGRTPIEHLWAERNRLDSVDHCTLGEAVERLVAGKNLESCRGRYVPVMPNLVGLPVWQFLKQLENRGIFMKWQDGPVSNDPQKIGTVQKQNPAPGTPLKTNRQVEVWVYSPSADIARVPDFVGQEAAKAKSDLEKLGVTVKWREGSIAKDTAQQGLVEKQHPAPGSILENIKEVELWVYRYATKRVEVPNVVGMTFANARATLKKAGLQAKIGKTLAPLTLNPNQKVKIQEAAAGAKVPKEEQIVLHFAEEDWSKKLPPLTLSGVAPEKGRVPDVLSPDSLSKEPNTMVKRDPASAFGGKKTPDNSATINGDWAGMWRVDRKYDMELNVSGNQVTGRYGKNMKKTIEGTMLGNTLIGWWREGKKYGRFENTLSDDGNAWSGVWNMMTDKLGRWNGGWTAKRIGDKKPPAPSIKRDPVSAFGSRTTPDSASATGGSGSVPDHMTCEAGVAGLKTSNKKRVGSLQQGEVGVRKEGIADYVCWYVTSRGDEVLVKPSFFVRTPETRESGGKGRNLIAFCDRPAYSDVYGVGAHGKAMKITIGKYSANKLSQSQLQQLVNFHTNQMVSHAISCSSSSRQTPKAPRTTPPVPLSPSSGRGLDMQTAGSCRQLPPPPSHMHNPTCQCSESNALFGTTTYTTCFWVDK